VLTLGDQYLTGVFPASAKERLTRGPLELVKCVGRGGCGLLQLGHSYDLSELYGPNYGYRSGLNSSMVRHLEEIVAKIKTIIGEMNPGDVVLDIGSNDGTLLGFYSDVLTRVGVDPTAVKFREFYSPGIQVLIDFFSAAKFRESFGDRKAKVVTSISMFYDLEAPMSFVEEVASILDDAGVWHFEQSYLPAMLRTNAYDTICHEHLEYYGLRQIKWMLDRGGLKIVDIELNDVNGGSFAITAAKNSSNLPEKSAAVEKMLGEETALGLGTLEPYHNFRDRVFAHREKLLSTLESLRAKGSKILGYGASTKGNVILQFCGITPATIPCMAEVNPDKFGKFTPGTAIPIVSEEEAHAMSPDYFLVMPWHFRENLLQREARFLEKGGRMIFPLPQIEVVP